MGTCEDLFKEVCPKTSDVEEEIKDGTDANDLESDITLKQLIKCQKEIDVFRRDDLTPDEIKTFHDKCIDTLKDLLIKRNETIDKIPRFWITVIRNNPLLPFRVNEYELDCLGHLTKFEIDELKDKANNLSGFKVSFAFDDNIYFQNDVLIKEISFARPGETTSTSTTISWNNNSESKRLQEELLKSLCSGSGSFFEWLIDNEATESVKFLQLVELWQNPFLYYTASEDCPGKDGNLLNNNTLLEDVKPYQEEINKLNNKLMEELVRSTAPTGKGYEVLMDDLYVQRNILIRKIPNFWATAISNHPDLSSVIGKEEIECLQYLTHMENDSECSKDHVKLIMNFHFVENNPYISNNIITKEFVGKDGEKTVQNTPIEWKNNKCLFSKQEDGDGSNCKKKAYNIFDWLNDDSCPEAYSYITLAFLQLWEDPVKYYLPKRRSRD